MKTIKRITKTFVIVGILLFSHGLFGQVNEARMDKDLRVAAKVLESLTQGDNNGFMMYSDNVEANYIDGYGVIFSIGGGYSFTMGSRSKAPTYSYRSGTYPTGIVIIDDNNNEKEEEDSDDKEVEVIDLSNIMIEFLIDYSQMINQLKPSDKIMISTKKSDYVYIIETNDGETHSEGRAGITTEMVKKDHNEFMEGKLSRENLISKIIVDKSNGSNGAKDLDLFSSMLSTVYDDEYTDSYFISWQPEYQRLKGVGAIYSFKVYSSYDEDGWYRMPSINKNGLNSEQRNAEVEKLYPVFVQSMKENIVQYGRTISSLEPEEMILLKVTLTKCDDCSIPKKIQFSIKQSVLTSFKSGKISEKEAIAKVVVTDL